MDITLTTQEILDLIFKDPKIKYDLIEFANLGRSIHQILDIKPKVITSGKDTGQTKYFLKSFVPFNSGFEIERASTSLTTGRLGGRWMREKMRL